MPNQDGKRRVYKPFLSYFLLALSIIVAYRVISDLAYFVNALKQIWSIMTPFFYGALFAYIFNIPCCQIERLLEKSKIHFIQKRKVAMSIVLLALILLLTILLILDLIIPAIINSVTFFVIHFPSYYESALSFIDYLNSQDIFGIQISLDEIISFLQVQLNGFSFENLSSSIVALANVSSAIFSGFLVLVSSIYFLIEKDKLKQFLNRLVKALMPSRMSDAIINYTGRLNENFKQYIYTQTIDGCILGSIVTLELYLLGSPYALILGIMLGIVNYIPYFGSIMGSIVAVVVVAFTQGITMAAIAAVILLITQQIDGNIIQPKLMGGSFSLSPLLIIISITIGGAVAGILGMIAAIPIVAVLKDILENILVYLEHERRIQSKG